uniref:Uncharacterized protein n=1 Tax=Romanomermis culicivorax TaxID=13658 RepID=A0A915J9P2_ROMCU
MSNSAAHNSNNTAKCLPSPFSATLQHMATHRNDLLMPSSSVSGHQLSINLPLNNPPNHNLHNG